MKHKAREHGELLLCDVSSFWQAKPASLTGLLHSQNSKYFLVAIVNDKKYCSKQMMATKKESSEKVNEFAGLCLRQLTVKQLGTTIVYMLLSSSMETEPCCASPEVPQALQTFVSHTKSMC